jgi:4-amino-4-deoxy-L-arabinose transferase-like glycosyltransferase
MQSGSFPATTEVAVLKEANKPPFAYLALIVVSSAIFIASTAHGIGILPDSVAYFRIGTAHHFAPLYTWLLQATSSLGLAINEAAWWLAWALLTANIVLILRLLHLARLGPTLAVIATALIVYHPVFVEYHSVAMTESLYFVLVLASLLVFPIAVTNGSRSGLALVGVLIGIGMLTRFAAAPLLPALMITRLLVGDGSLLNRVIDCVAMTAACVGVFGSWVVVSELTTGDSTGRAFEFLGSTDAAFWTATFRSASVMLLPAPMPSAARFLFLALASGAAVWAMARYVREWLRVAPDRRSDASALVPISLIFLAFFYAVFLIFSVMIQYRLNLTGRFLLPLYVFAALATASLFGNHSFKFPLSRTATILFAVIAGVVLTSNLARTALFTRSAYKSGLGYASATWAASPVLQAAEKLPAGLSIYSNAPDLIAFRLQRNASYLPVRFNHLTGRDDGPTTFHEEMNALRNNLDRANAYVVIVDGVNWRDYLISERELLLSIPLARLADLSDGRIYAASGASKQQQGAEDGIPR